MSALTLTCPHCSVPHEDTWEALDAGAIDEMRCDACGRQFAFVILECERCVHEQVMTWHHTPEPTALRLLTCESCHQPFVREEADA